MMYVPIHVSASKFTVLKNPESGGYDFCNFQVLCKTIFTCTKFCACNFSDFCTTH